VEELVRVSEIEIRVASVASGVLGIVGVVAILGAVWLLVKRSLDHAVGAGRIDATAASFVAAVVRYALLAVAVVGVLGQLGVDTASLLGSLGILGLTLGFAARDALSNIISGLFILWDRPFTIGDLIEANGEYGRVKNITMRSTRVVTPDGRMLAFPNSTLVNATVASYTNFPHLRLDIDLTVGVGEDLGRVRRLLLELVEGREGFLSEPEPRVVVTDLNDYNVAVALQAWIEDERRHIPERFALREDVFLTLRRDGVDMPFETLRLAPVEVKRAG
jgi:small conductance mechanosensitive channel